MNSTNNYSEISRISLNIETAYLQSWFIGKDDFVIPAKEPKENENIV